MNTTNTLDTINATLSALEIDERVSYSATMRDGLVLVSCDCDAIDDVAEAYDAQESADRAMGAAMESLGLSMADSGCDGTEGQSWSTWRASTVDTITHRDIVDGTTVTTAYNDIAPVYGESRAYAALDADEREWWDATLTRMHAVAVAAARLPAKVRDRVIHAGDDGDLESAIGAQERALVEETERGAAVFGCDESDLRIVERAEAPDAGF